MSSGYYLKIDSKKHYLGNKITKYLKNNWFIIAFVADSWKLYIPLENYYKNPNLSTRDAKMAMGFIAAADGLQITLDKVQKKTEESSDFIEANETQIFIFCVDDSTNSFFLQFNDVDLPEIEVPSEPIIINVQNKKNPYALDPISVTFPQRSCFLTRLLHIDDEQ